MTLNRTLAGKRVRLDSSGDPFTKLTPGTLGTIDYADDAGTLHVTWDNGSNLGLVAGEDHWTVLAASADAVRYPNVSVTLIGEDGNVFNLLGLTRRAMRAAGVPADEVATFMAEAMASESYDHVLALIGRTVEVN